MFFVGISWWTEAFLFCSINKSEQFQTKDPLKTQKPLCSFQHYQYGHWSVTSIKIFWIALVRLFDTLLEKVYFFRSKSWFVPKKRTFFSDKGHFWFQKTNIFSTITVLNMNLFIFRVFVLRVCQRGNHASCITILVLLYTIVYRFFLQILNSFYS
jgi:hypothetical protein